MRGTAATARTRLVYRGLLGLGSGSGQILNQGLCINLLSGTSKAFQRGWSVAELEASADGKTTGVVGAGRYRER